MKECLIKFVNGEIIPVDKMLHFAFCYIIASTTFILSISPKIFGFDEVISMAISLIVVIIISIIKEIFDSKVKKTGWDIMDVLSGILGGLVYLIIERLL